MALQDRCWASNGACAILGVKIHPRARLSLQLRVLPHEIITALQKRANILPNTTQHLQGMAASGASASEFHRSGVTDGLRDGVADGKDGEHERRGPEKGNQKTE